MAPKLAKLDENCPSNRQRKVIHFKAILHFSKFWTLIKHHLVVTGSQNLILLNDSLTKA